MLLYHVQNRDCSIIISVNNHQYLCFSVCLCVCVTLYVCVWELCVIVSVCLCVCDCMCVWHCMSAYRSSVCVWLYVCLSVWVCDCMCVCMCGWHYVCVQVVCVCVFVCACVFVCLCTGAIQDPRLWHRSCHPQGSKKAESDLADPGPVECVKDTLGSDGTDKQDEIRCSLLCMWVWRDLGLFHFWRKPKNATYKLITLKSRVGST